MQRGQIGVPHLLQLRRVSTSGWNVQRCESVIGAAMIPDGRSTLSGELFPDNKRHELRQSQLTAPSPGLSNQPIQPLESYSADQIRSTRYAP